MRQHLRRSVLLFTLSAAATACTAGPGEPNARTTDPLNLGSVTGIGTVLPTFGTNQSFLTPASWSKDFASSTGWNPSKHVRLLADIDHDGKQDIVGFGDAGVYVARSLGTSFETPARFVLAAFGDTTGGAWNDTDDIRTLADIDGDGRPDIVGFGTDGVWTALSNGTGFASAHYVLADFGYNQGWRVATHVRTLADVNGDGRADIVGYGNAGVYVSLATGGGGFGPASFMIANFGADQGWNNTQHVRTTGDIDGDGRADIVAFGYDGVWTALSNSSATSPSFQAYHYVLAQFGSSSAAGSWTAGGRHERRVVDVDGDHKADILGFGESGTYFARSNGDGGFTSATLVVNDFGFQQVGYTWLAESARFVGDFDGDGLVDIVAYKNSDSIRRSLGAGGGGFFAPGKVMQMVGNIGGQIDAGDVDGDGKPDLVGYTDKDVMVERSTASPPPPPPAAPTNVHIISSSPSSIYVGWNDNSSDEVGFGVGWTDNMTNPGFKVAPKDAISNNVTGLKSLTRYCFTIESIGWFGTSPAPQVCGSTELAGPTVTENAHTHTSLGWAVQGISTATELRWHLDSGAVQTVAGNSGTPGFTDLAPGSNHCLHAQQLVGSTWSVETVTCASTDVVQTGTTSLALKENIPDSGGNVIYSGAWQATEGTITSFTSADNLPTIGLAFIKVASYTGGLLNPLCDDSNNVIYLGGGGTLTASQVAQVAFPGPNGESDFYACGINRPIASYLFTNVNWQK